MIIVEKGIIIMPHRVIDENGEVTSENKGGWKEDPNGQFVLFEEIETINDKPKLSELSDVVLFTNLPIYIQNFIDKAYNKRK